MGSKSAIGIGNGICFKQVRDKGGGSYIDPLVRDSIVGLWKFDQNTNESPTRNIIKNTIKGKGGDLELLNFAYKANSGYNGYPEDFTSWNYNTGLIVSLTKVQNNGDAGRQLIYYHTSIRKEDVLEFKVKITLDEQSKIKYWYIKEDGTGTNITYSESGTYTIPTSYFSKYIGENTWFGFEQLSGGCTIEQLPLYEGALVTDGKDDMIVSQKTVQEMGITDEITVVSMIHQIGMISNINMGLTNYIRNQNIGFIRNNIDGNSIGKTGIYGYTWNNSTKSVINNILGDKKDYIVDSNASFKEGKFTVEGCINNDLPTECNEVAVYWTFISNKVLTTDEINQIIAYFKLDKYVTPQIIYDVKRQGLTNDTPAADWYLKDFSKNGFDMSLFNFAKKGNSGVGKYETDFLDSSIWKYKTNSSVTSDKIVCNKAATSVMLLYYIITDGNKYDVPSFNVLKQGDASNYYYYIDEQGIRRTFKLLDGINTLPASHGTLFTGIEIQCGFGNPGIGNSVTITQIPSHAGALCLDGVNDFGKVTGMPVYKDYTVVADYERLKINIGVDSDSPILSKSESTTLGAFMFNTISSSGDKVSYSFGRRNIINADDTIRKIFYQSKYINDGQDINIESTFVDSDKLWLGTYRDSDYHFIEAAIYSLMSFPYSMSEFLIERQLKKHKLGTLYPDMIEWRPIAKSNIPYKQIDYFIRRSGTYVRLNPGDYFQSTEDIIVRVTPIRDWQLDVVSSIKVNGKNEVISVNSSYTQTAPIHIDKSPQKIDITIDEYIRYEDIVQPYPFIFPIVDTNNKVYSWGDKVKVDTEIKFAYGSNLLPQLYKLRGEVMFNGNAFDESSRHIIGKTNIFTLTEAPKYLKDNEPNCILAPQILRIPNASYKILGYIPDLTGKGNHGRLNNFAYTEESGANEDGSIRFDGVDDYIIIPTIKHGGKALLMKVNWRYKNNIAMVYDQRIKWVGFGISISRDQLPSVAYKPYNKVTYIDGIKNESVLVQDLEGITHNITGIYDNLNLSDERDVCISRTSDASNSGFADMSMYEFMLFPDVPNEEEIKELNDIVGIEGGYVESPNYYWDTYGKKNTDADRNLIADQVSKDVANALEIKNVGYNSESGYTDDNGLLLDGIEDHAVNTVIPAVTDFTVIGKRNILNHESGFAIKGGNTTSTAAFVLEYGSDKFYNFGGVNTVEYPDTITVATKSSYNGNPVVSSQGKDSLGLRIGEYRNYYSKLAFYKLMLYTKTIDQLYINMLKNLFERDELIDVTNPIFKKEEL